MAARRSPLIVSRRDVARAGCLRAMSDKFMNFSCDRLRVVNRAMTGTSGLPPPHLLRACDAIGGIIEESRQAGNRGNCAICVGEDRNSCRWN